MGFHERGYHTLKKEKVHISHTFIRKKTTVHDKLTTGTCICMVESPKAMHPANTPNATRSVGHTSDATEQQQSHCGFPKRISNFSQFWGEIIIG